MRNVCTWDARATVGDGKEVGDAEPDLGLLLGRQHTLRQRAVSERHRLLAPGGGVQQHRDPGHQRAAQQMMPASQVQGTAGQPGRLSRGRCWPGRRTPSSAS